MSQSTFGDSCGVTKNSQINYETDRRSPDAGYLMAAASLGVDILYVLTGQRQPEPRPSMGIFGPLQDLVGPIDHPLVDAWKKSVSAPSPVQGSFSLREADFAHIPVLDAEVSAGPGSTNGDEMVLDHLAFRQDWLHRLRVTPDQATLVHVHGESMKPTLHPGDMVLLDTSDLARELPVRNRPPGKGRVPIYALRIDGETRVKRLLRPDIDTLVMLSDNPDWAPEVWSGARLREVEPSIIGKVVWWGHTELM